MQMFCEGGKILNLQRKFAKTETRYFPMYCYKGGPQKYFFLDPIVIG